VASDWGQKQFAAYLGRDEAAVGAARSATAPDATAGFPGEMLIDQGARTSSCTSCAPRRWPRRWRRGGRPAAFRMQAGYDHSYFFVSTFMEEHVRFHAEAWARDLCRCRRLPGEGRGRGGGDAAEGPVRMVSNGGIRPSANPLVEMVYVSEGPDEADKWIAERAGPGDVVVTADVPLAAGVAAGARVLRHDGEALTEATSGRCSRRAT
jgi:hypothetical protein